MWFAALDDHALERDAQHRRAALRTHAFALVGSGREVLRGSAIGGVFARIDLREHRVELDIRDELAAAFLALGGRIEVGVALRAAHGPEHTGWSAAVIRSSRGRSDDRVARP